MKKLLAIVAHPDDESFGFGGTLAKYAQDGVEIHVLCATRGEAGEGAGDLGKIREVELKKASDIIGVSKLEFLDYHDGTLSNSLYHDIAKHIEVKIKAFQPQVVLTFNQQGISGHLDHIAMSLITTYVCQKYSRKLSLFYLTELKSYTRFIKNYFIYFPPGIEEKDVDVTIDIKNVWNIKKQAMLAHTSQLHDARRILLLKRFFPKCEYFQSAFLKKQAQSHTDFFAY